MKVQEVVQMPLFPELAAGKQGVHVMRLPHAADLPKYETEGAAGMDLRAALDEEVELLLHPGERLLVPTGLCFAIPLGWEAQVRPRSGLAWKHGVTVLNSPGTIDSDYRGEVKVMLVNHGQEPFQIKRGERVAQVVFAQAPQVYLREVDTLDSTERGAGGFGSTGKA